MDPDIVAELFGFGSGQQLVQILKITPAPPSVIDELTDFPFAATVVAVRESGTLDLTFQHHTGAIGEASNVPFATLRLTIATAPATSRR